MTTAKTDAHIMTMLNLRPLLRTRFIASLLLILSSIGCGQAVEPSPYNCSNTPPQYQNLPTTTEYMFVLWRPENQSTEDFSATLFALLGSDSDPQSVPLLISGLNLKVLIHQPGGGNGVGQPLPDGSRVAAVMTVGVNSQEEALEVSALFEPLTSFIAAYEVERVVPLDYERNWLDDEYSPGILQVSFLQRKIGMTDQEYHDYWTCAHAPFFLELQPIWRYERNQQIIGLTPGAPTMDGLVTLHVENESDFIGLAYFNGSLLNSLRFGADVRMFLDLNSVENVPMRELIIRSGL